MQTSSGSYHLPFYPSLLFISMPSFILLLVRFLQIPAVNKRLHPGTIEVSMPNHYKGNKNKYFPDFECTTYLLNDRE